MVTEVLLMTEVADLGAEGDVVKVSDGYARNYLLPGKLAAPVTEATRRKLAKLRQVREVEKAATLGAAKEAAARLEKVSCTIPMKSAGEGKLYGSVTTADIVANLKNQGIEVAKNSIVLDAPLKDLGVFNVKVILHPEVEATLRVWVVEE
jgi:large subunit ribosomal protein L9